MFGWPQEVACHGLSKDLNKHYCFCDEEILRIGDKMFPNIHNNVPESCGLGFDEMTVLYVKTCNLIMVVKNFL